MRALQGMILSLLLGLVGAALWVGLSRVYDLWLLVTCALLIGPLVGLGMAMGTKVRGGTGLGLTSAFICLLCCLTAKGAIAYFRASDFVSEQAVVADEDVYDVLCQETYYSLVDEGVLTGNEQTYPLAVYDAASAQWRSMSEAQRDAYRASVSTEWGRNQGAATGVVSILAFFLGWGILDIFCVCSAIGTAYKIGSHQSDQELEPGLKHIDLPTPAQAPIPPIADPSITRRPIHAATATPQVSASDSFWTRLGSEPPARDTPSMRRTPAPAGSPSAGSHAEAA